MVFEVGSVVGGKVTGLTKFGAFVALEEGKSGLVHISEIANKYVSDVSEHLSVGQEVKVKIIGIDENGRINLSIKKAIEQEPRRERIQPQQRTSRPAAAYTPPQKQKTSEEPQSFEDKLKRFMQESDSRMSDINRKDKRSGNRRRSR